MITVFVTVIWGGISLDIRSECLFYDDAICTTVYLYTDLVVMQTFGTLCWRYVQCLLLKIINREAEMQNDVIQ